MSTAGAPIPGNSIVIYHQPFDANGTDPDTVAGGAQPEGDRNRAARNDWNLKRAVDWLAQVRAATPAAEQDGVIINAIPKPRLGENAADDLFFDGFTSSLEARAVEVGGEAGKKLTPASLEAPWAKLAPGHTLVLLMHGTTGKASLDPKRDIGGIKLFDNHAGTDVVLDEEQLEQLLLVAVEEEVEGKKVKRVKVQKKPLPPAPPPPAPPIVDYPQDLLDQRVPLLQALRDSPFQRIVLLACGTKNRLKEFGPLLATLTGKVVHFNAPHPVFVDFRKPASNIHTHVGADEVEAHAARGQPWVPTTPASTPALTSTDKTFLPGTTHLATPGPAP